MATLLYEAKAGAIPAFCIFPVLFNRRFRKPW
ncbi:hypothetical protein C8N36_107226 [Pelagimonas varians]|uniref:Uncharacterized protein n=1 Tax=Pelagimonas varians TaxID=696760 RepID=A0A238KBV6_9RHOB|nr:hypothetical protein C8N36_107226 [Pelagimonas varians]SMX40295.1 hypothetical protein PEV8663_01970 [Pelagimonas varians]